MEEVDVWGTDPTNPDSDGDGVIDGHETYLYQTDPLDPNSLPGADGTTQPPPAP
ncbi:MAG: hypothetical protein AAF602_15215 [Myxococcota bacterium]